jgi:hypothetical protein
VTEDVRTGAIWLIAVATAAITAICVVIAWDLVAPAPPLRALPASTLEHGLIEQTRWVDPGARELERTAWVDRAARTARIPIETAIDAVVADPSLIAHHRGAEARR